MSILGWLVLGLIAGFIASKIVNHTGSGVLMDIVLGIVGALVGGWLFATFGGMPVTGFNLYSMFVAVIGAIVVLVLYHAVAGRRPPRPCAYPAAFAISSATSSFFDNLPIMVFGNSSRISTSRGISILLT